MQSSPDPAAMRARQDCSVQGTATETGIRSAGAPARGCDPVEAKRALRRHFRTLRREALAAATPGLRAAAVARLPSLLPPGRWLGLYWPVGSEPDLDPWAPGGLAERLNPSGVEARLALPVVLPPQPGEEWGRLMYRPWRREAPLRPDACGIPAPLPPETEQQELRSPAAQDSDSPPAAVLPAAALPPEALPPEALGLLLVPALAVDRGGLRLGSGGGWYDRLRADPAWRAVPALAVLPSACVVEQLPRDPWDVPFSGWLDERGVGEAERPGRPG